MRCCMLTALHWWCLLLLSARDYGSHQATARALSLLLLCPWCLNTVNKRFWRIFNLATFGKSDSGKVGVAAAALLEAWPSVQEVYCGGVCTCICSFGAVSSLMARQSITTILCIYILLAARIYPVFPSQAKLLLYYMVVVVVEYSGSSYSSRGFNKENDRWDLLCYALVYHYHSVVLAFLMMVWTKNL